MCDSDVWNTGDVGSQRWRLSCDSSLDKSSGLGVERSSSRAISEQLCCHLLLPGASPTMARIDRRSLESTGVKGNSMDRDKGLVIDVEVVEEKDVRRVDGGDAISDSSSLSRSTGRIDSSKFICLLGRLVVFEKWPTLMSF